jgi:hypothetical protein
MLNLENVILKTTPICDGEFVVFNKGGLEKYVSRTLCSLSDRYQA